jgi:hypothetical protein
VNGTDETPERKAIEKDIQRMFGRLPPTEEE